MTRDNKYIVSASGDNTIIIWNVSEKTQETVLQEHTSSVKCVAVTSDNKYIISGSYDKTIRVWNLLKKRQETVLRGYSSSVECLAVTINILFRVLEIIQ